MKFSFVPVACHFGHFGTTRRWVAGGARRVGERWERWSKGGSATHILNPEGPRREHACQKLRKMRDYHTGSLSSSLTKGFSHMREKAKFGSRTLCMSWTKYGKKFMSLIHYIGVITSVVVDMFQWGRISVRKCHHRDCEFHRKCISCTFLFTF